jgi:hypothetical protein
MFGGLAINIYSREVVRLVAFHQGFAFARRSRRC